MYFFSVYKSKRKSATCHETNRKNYYQEVIERINQDILLDFVLSNILVKDRVKIKLVSVHFQILCHCIYKIFCYKA